MVDPYCCRWSGKAISYPCPTGPIKKAKQPMKSRFTLIELLVVIAIIGILASLLLPALKRARDTAIGSQCISNLRHTVLAINIYSVDANDCYPVLATRADQTSSISPNPFAPDAAWLVASRNFYTFLVNGYASNHPLYQSHDVFEAGKGALTSRPVTPYFCPADKHLITGKVATYTGLYFIQAQGHNPHNKQWNSLCLPGRQLVTMPASPAAIIMLAESSGALNGSWGGAGYATVGSDTYSGSTDEWDIRKSIGCLPNYAQWVPTSFASTAYTHPNGLNFAMVDGHVARSENPPHAIWGSTDFVFKGTAIPEFDPKGRTPLR